MSQSSPEDAGKGANDDVGSGKAMRAGLLVEHACELITLAGPAGPRRGAAQSQLAAFSDGAVAAGPDGRILAAGPTPEVRAAIELAPDARVIDATGRTVMPGFVDCHTHAVFGGDRVDEFARRLEGVDYLDILAAGGGILSTVRETRGTSRAALERRARGFLWEMLLHGTTSVEIKTGYGLTVDDEIKMLRVVASLAVNTPLTVVGTLLAAHATPPEFSGRTDAYLDLVVTEMIPRVSEERLGGFCDVFCERGVFTVEQSRRVLEAGAAAGLAPKVHAEQKSAFGGARLAAEVHAVSADHLEHATDADIAALSESGTIAVLLPGAALMLMESTAAPARKMVEAGVPVALATDFNPGSCPITSMQIVIGLACLRRLLTPAEAIVASTINAAYAIGLGAEVGSLEVGKQADLVILDAPSHEHIPYWFGRNLVATVVKDGTVV